MEILQTIRAIAEYKAKEQNKYKEDARSSMEYWENKGNKDQVRFWEEAEGRCLSKWSAYNDIVEAIDLYLK